MENKQIIEIKYNLFLISNEENNLLTDKYGCIYIEDTDVNASINAIILSELKKYDKFEKLSNKLSWTIGRQASWATNNCSLVISIVNTNNVSYFKYMLQFIKFKNDRQLELLLYYCYCNGLLNIVNYININLFKKIDIRHGICYSVLGGSLDYYNEHKTELIKETYGIIILYYACLNGNLDNFLQLANEGCNIGRFVMTYSLINESMNIIQWLEDNYAWNPVSTYELIIGRKNMKMLKWAHNKGYKPNMSLLLFSIRHSNLEIVKYVNEHMMRYRTARFGYYYSIINNNLEMMKYLLKYKISDCMYRRSEKTRQYYSVINKALTLGDEEIIKWIIINYPYKAKYIEECNVDKFYKIKREIKEEITEEIKEKNSIQLVNIKYRKNRLLQMNNNIMGNNDFMSIVKTYGYMHRKDNKNIRNKLYVFCCDLLLLASEASEIDKQNCYNEFEKRLKKEYWTMDNWSLVIEVVNTNNVEHFKYMLKFIEFRNDEELRSIIYYCYCNKLLNIVDYINKYLLYEVEIRKGICYSILGGSLDYYNKNKTDLIIQTYGRYILYYACINGNLDNIKQLIKDGCEIGNNILGYALTSGNYNTFQWLDNKYIKSQYSLFRVAIFKKDLQMVKWLHVNEYKLSKHILTFAVKNNTIEIVKYIITYYPISKDYVCDVYCSSTKNNNLEMLKLLLKHKVKFDNLDARKENQKKYHSTINEALKSNNKDIIKWVILNYPYQAKYIKECNLDKFYSIKREMKK